MESEIMGIKARLDEIEGWKNPQNVEGRIEMMAQTLEDLQKIVSTINAKLQILNFDDRLMEEFSDDKLENIYANSGIKIETLSDVLLKAFPVQSRGIKITTIKQINSPHMRSYAGKYLRFHAAKRPS